MFGIEWNIFFIALGLALFFEGLIYAASPDTLKKIIRQILDVPNDTIRVFALSFSVVGLIIIYWVK